MQPIRILPAQAVHYPQIQRLNSQAIPHVNHLSRGDLEKLAKQSRFFLVALDGQEQVTAFLLALDQRADYASPNFRYFADHYEQFLYIDRIVVHPDHQRQGLGKSLYQAIVEKTGEEFSLLTCEVNLRPPNPISLEFHRGCGFSGVHEQETEQGSKRVLLMTRPCRSPESHGGTS